MSRVRSQHPPALVSPVGGAGGGPLLRLVMTSNGTRAVVGNAFRGGAKAEHGREM